MKENSFFFSILLLPPLFRMYTDVIKEVVDLAFSQQQNLVLSPVLEFLMALSTIEMGAETNNSFSKGQWKEVLNAWKLFVESIVSLRRTS